MERTATNQANPHDHLDARWADTVDRLRAFVAARVEDREVAADITQDVIVRRIASGALERVDVAGETHHRAAATLGISVSGMKSRVHCGRRELKDLLEAVLHRRARRHRRRGRLPPHHQPLPLRDSTRRHLRDRFVALTLARISARRRTHPDRHRAKTPSAVSGERRIRVGQSRQVPSRRLPRRSEVKRMSSKVTVQPAPVGDWASNPIR